MSIFENILSIVVCLLISDLEIHLKNLYLKLQNKRVNASRKKLEKDTGDEFPPIPIDKKMSMIYDVVIIVSAVLGIILYYLFGNNSDFIVGTFQKALYGLFFIAVVLNINIFVLKFKRTYNLIKNKDPYYQNNPS